MTRPTPKPRKPSKQRGRAYGEGGDTPMHGKGDRTVTADADAAGEQTPAITSQKSKRNPRFIEGGQKTQAVEEGERAAPRVKVAGGLAYPAMAGACGTGTEVIPAGEKHWHGGKKI